MFVFILIVNVCIHSDYYLIFVLCALADTLIFEGVEVTGYQIFEDPKVQKAIEFASTAHLGQFRRTGDPYVTHCIHTGKILAALVPSTGERVFPSPSVFREYILHFFFFTSLIGECFSSFFPYRLLTQLWLAFFTMLFVIHQRA